MSINPYVYSNFSSVNYYESNVTRRLNGMRRGPGANAITSQLTSTTVVQDKGFKLLNTDFQYRYHMSIATGLLPLRPLIQCHSIKLKPLLQTQ